MILINYNTQMCVRRVTQVRVLILAPISSSIFDPWYNIQV